MNAAGESPTSERGQLTGIERVVALQGAALFRYCRSEEIFRLAAIARERRVSEGETIYEEGDPADALYCLIRGGVEVGGEEPGSSRRVGPLETFGVLEILSGRLRAGRATAAADSTVLALDAEDFFDLLSNNIDIVKSLFRQLLERDKRGEYGGANG